MTALPQCVICGSEKVTSDNTESGWRCPHESEHWPRTFYLCGCNPETANESCESIEVVPASERDHYRSAYEEAQRAFARVAVTLLIRGKPITAEELRVALVRAGIDSSDELSRLAALPDPKEDE